MELIESGGSQRSWCSVDVASYLHKTALAISTQRRICMHPRMTPFYATTSWPTDLKCQVECYAERSTCVSLSVRPCVRFLREV